jgi:hypothetical protein
MLDFLRRSATSVFAWIILGVLALVFGLSFGLPSENLTLGPEKIVKVHGESIGDEDFRYELNLAARLGLVPKEPERRELMGVHEEVLDGIVERIVMSKAAEDMGLQATQKQAEDEVLKGHFIVFGFTLDFLGPDQPFNYDLFKNSWLAGLRVPEPHYLEYQRQEVLARTLRDVIESSVVVSEAELRKAYDDTANTISLRYARYESSAFADLVDPTPDEIEAYVKAHEADLKAQLATQGSRFTKLAKQHRLWLVEIPRPLPEVGPDGEPIVPSEESVAAARATAEAARARLDAGEDFRAVAREVSKHQSARRGGDYGWVGEGQSGLDAIVDETAAKLEAGETSALLEGESAWWIVRITGRREGDVPEADALAELAEDAVRTQKGKELARQAANEDKDLVLAGTPTSEVFDTSGALGIDVAPGEDAPIEDRPLEGEAAGKRGRPKVALTETGPFGRGQPIPRLGPAPEVVEAAWNAEEPADGEAPELLDEVFELGDGFVLVGRVSKEQSTDEGFAEARVELYDQLAQRKANTASARFAVRQCLEAKAKGDIKVSEEKVKRLMTYDTKEDGSPEAPEAPAELGLKPYSVCDRVGNRGGVMTARLRFFQ